VNIAERIESLEERIVNAPTIETARRLHDELDELRARIPTDAAAEDASRGAYEAGYQAGYHAGIRRASKRRSPNP
jgi:uncharacterized membrane protein